MPSAKLTKRQRRFVGEYLKTNPLNAAEAMRHTNPACRNPDVQAAKMMARDDVRGEIERAMAAREERTHITQDYVLRTIQETVERARQAVPVRDKDGNPVTVVTPGGAIAAVYRFDAKAVLAGASLLMDHLGMKRQRVEHTGPEGVPLAPPVFNFGFGKGGPGEPGTGSQGS